MEVKKKNSMILIAFRKSIFFFFFFPSERTIDCIEIRSRLHFVKLKNRAEERRVFPLTKSKDKNYVFIFAENFTIPSLRILDSQFP